MDADRKSTKVQKALLTQLTELNSRSRWYSSQLWQVPFAYLGITGVGLGVLRDRSSNILASAFIMAGVLGLCVLAHFIAVMFGERRAVKNLREIEQELKLPQTVTHSFGRALPLLIMLLVIVFVCLRVGVDLLFR